MPVWICISSLISRRVHVHNRRVDNEHETKYATDQHIRRICGVFQRKAAVQLDPNSPTQKSGWIELMYRTLREKAGGDGPLEVAARRREASLQTTAREMDPPTNADALQF